MEHSNNPYDPNNPYPPQDDKLGTPLTIVSFCLPIVGAILYFVHRTKSPAKAKTACYAALAGFAVGIVLQLIMYGTGMSGRY
ncbi:MAG: hypothetical protein EOO08_09100 [Chitinophagaceae bacterium]|nr:MAG: hypothetical protein EOO08_09100 [Chitinophagaceae bacterium]